MNYLSHYYLERGGDRPHFTFGLIFPDLSRNYDADWKIRKGIMRNNFADQLLVHINEGVLRHFEMDMLFHNSSFFKEQTGRITEIFKKNKLESINKYMFFFSHVTLELMLDRLLLKNHPDVGDQFYNDLDKVENSMIDLYVKSLSFTNDPKGFIEYFERFREKRYLFHYLNNQHFIFALTKIYSRIRITEFSATEIAKLERCIEEIEESLSEIYTSIFHELLSTAS